MSELLVRMQNPGPESEPLFRNVAIVYTKLRAFAQEGDPKKSPRADNLPAKLDAGGFAKHPN
jgi:hypothetical protein